MRFYHLADLHFGKSIYGRSMLEDQRYWADQFLQHCRNEKPDALLIAGDVYDRSAPAAEAVELLDYFLTELAGMDITVIMIAGNHDSGRRLSFGSSMLAKQKIHIAGTASKEMAHVRFEDPDGYGPVTFWLMPYTYPEQISVIFNDDEIRTYEQAVRKLIDEQHIDQSERNVILSHQNVTANGKEAERGGSESMAGGIGRIDFPVFDAFDYAALGHIHSAYPVGRNEVRYAGTPLCYHMAETRQKDKGFTEVILKEKGSSPQIRTIPVRPLHRMRYFSGTKEYIYDVLKEDQGRDEYIGITITDQRITPEISSYLKQMFTLRGSVLMELLSSFSLYAGHASAAEKNAAETKRVEELFSDLYTEQCGGTPPSDEEYELMKYAGEIVRNSDAHEAMDPKDIEKIVLQAAKITGGMQ